MKKILFSILAIAALIGCGKDDNNSDVPAYSAEEAKTEVKATMDNFYECLKKAIGWCKNSIALLSESNAISYNK